MSFKTSEALWNQKQNWNTKAEGQGTQTSEVQANKVWYRIFMELQSGQQRFQKGKSLF